jgi:hypothetical protein
MSVKVDVSTKRRILIKDTKKRLLWRVSETKKVEMSARYRELRSEELRNICSSLNANRMVKSRWEKCEGHVAQIVVLRCHDNNIYIFI